MIISFDSTQLVLLLITGLIVAIPTSMAGLGGGILYLPILILVFQVPPNNAIAMSLLAMTGNTVSCTISYAIQRRVDYKLAMLYDVLDFPGIWIGALLTTILYANLVIGLVAGIIIVMGYLLIRNVARRPEKACSVSDLPIPSSNPVKQSISMAKPIAVEDGISPRRKRIIVSSALISSFGSGFVSGFAGIGGGVTDTTTMILSGVPPEVACPTSECAMAITNIVAVLFHFLLGNVIWDGSLALMIGAVIGAQIGARLSRKAKPRYLVYILVGFAWFSAIRMLLSILWGI